MTKKMLIDASHAEETRVVVLDGNRLEDFDVETVSRKQIKGNIYLAKVIRVEPSLQAAFVEYGGNRHGFLAFGEIHPDYYQIPVADRKRLLAQQAEDAAAEDAREEQNISVAPPAANAPAIAPEAAESTDSSEPADTAQPLQIQPIAILSAPPPEEAALPEESAPAIDTAGAAPESEAPATEATGEATDGGTAENAAGQPEMPAAPASEPTADAAEPELVAELPPPENLGGDGDDAAEARERRQRQRFTKNYKIQDVIHRRQIMLIQVVKEERGNKGAALTTYLSLAGRFSVLMPNSPSGGGVSRKITSVADRRRLKEAMAELDVPDGMGLIVRTAGANRPKPEIKRDCEYLLRLWDDIRDRTMESIAPALIYEEASLIKRTIRDVYTRDVEEVLVDGEEGFKAAHDFMRMLMPSHAKKVRLWSEGQPLFGRYQVEAQLDAMLNPVVQLRSGGYIVINQTEALVAIDVNSGRSTRERSIEDTALRTNLEAVEEVAKQLRMRDLAGLIVIDLIDMESRKNNAAVERRLKEALKNDRARIQVGNISHFGLMEMSRQRLRPSLTEASLVVCPHCAGMGHIRSPESAALHILRAIEEEGAKFRSAEISVVLPQEIAFYLFNHKRERLSAIEERYSMRVIFTPDAAMTGTNFRIDKIKAQTALPPAPAPAAPAGPITPERSVERHAPALLAEEVESETDEEQDAADAPSASDTAEEGERKRRRRRRRGKRRPDTAPESQVPADGESPAIPMAESAAETGTEEAGAVAEVPADPAPAPVEDQPSEIDRALAAALGEPDEAAEAPPAEEPVRRRRTRGGTRRRRVSDGDAAPAEEAPAGEATPPAEPVFADIADIFEAAERAEAEMLRTRTAARKAKAEAAAAPEPQPMPEPEPTPEPELEPAPEAAETPSEPAVKPTLISADIPVAEKKRGWWRR
jgi:ribonuclease E